MSTDQLEPSRQTRVPLLDEPDSDDSSVTVVQRRRLRPWIVFVQSCREKEKVWYYFADLTNGWTGSAGLPARRALFKVSFSRVLYLKVL